MMMEKSSSTLKACLMENLAEQNECFVNKRSARGGGIKWLEAPKIN